MQPAQRSLAATLRCWRTMLVAWIGPWLAVGVTGCFTPKQGGEDLLAAGFRTPEQTFATFQTAMAFDLADLEYRCFSTGFKRRAGLSALTWSEMRRRLRDEYPLIGVVTGAVIVESRALDVRSHEVVAEVAGRTARMRLVREDFWEIWGPSGRAADGSAHFDQLSELSPTANGGEELVVRLPFDRDSFPKLDPRAISEVRLGREWLIDEIGELASTSP